MNYKQELETAKKAALAAGQILIEQKNNLNKSIFSSNTTSVPINSHPTV